MLETTQGLLEEGESYLNIDFNQASRPELVTEVLEVCKPSKDKIWELTVGQRIAHLLGFATEDGKQEIDVQLTCLNANCNKLLELTFTLAEFLEVHTKAEEQAQLELLLQNKKLLLRRPTGFDQQQWQQLFFENQAVAANTFINTLLVEPKEFNLDSLTPEEFEYIDEAMQAFDPLVNFSFETSCPECNESFSYELDLQELALQRLRQIQNKFLENIHKLAFNYHWSESQILALPQWRFRKYLALLNDEVA